MSFAICMVLVRSEEVESVLPHGVHEFVVAGAKPLYATRRALALERGTPLCGQGADTTWQLWQRWGKFGSGGAVKQKDRSSGCKRF